MQGDSMMDMTEKVGIYPNLVVFTTYDERLRRRNTGYWGITKGRKQINVFLDRIGMVTGIRTIFQNRYIVEIRRDDLAVVTHLFDTIVGGNLMMLSEGYDVEGVSKVYKLNKFIELMSNLARAGHENGFRFMAEHFDKFVSSKGLYSPDFEELYAEAWKR
jgi:hypothetical protein